jgi:hypothetical protein
MKNLIRAFLTLTLVAFTLATFTACTKTTEVVEVKEPVKTAPPKKKKKKKHVPTPAEFEVVNSYDQK